MTKNEEIGGKGGRKRGRERERRRWQGMRGTAKESTVGAVPGTCT
jgi:hypothetical protein